jgi:hypothetical protein
LEDFEKLYKTINGHQVRYGARCLHCGKEYSAYSRCGTRTLLLSYGHPWAHYSGRYQDRLLGGPLGLPYLGCTALDGVEHKAYRGLVLN